MCRKAHKTIAIVGAALLPFALQAAFLVASHEIVVRLPDILGLAIPFAFAVCGAACLIYGLGSIGFMIGLGYLPIMTLLLIGFSLEFVGRVYGDWP